MKNTNSNPKVTIIIPIYNVEKYIRECLESVINQTYKNIEIIVIDDGTPDKSGEIADEFAKKDSRIKVIHSKNAGVATARNKGLDKATGEYIMFIDSDDYVTAEYVEYFLGLINETKADIAMSLNNFTATDKIQIKEDKIEIYTPSDAIQALYLYEVGVAVWNKIWRREFIEKKQLRFQPFMYYGEGTTFCIVSFQEANCIGVGRRKVLYQRDNMESATRKFNINSREHGIENLQWQKEHLKINDKIVNRAWSFHYWRSNCSNLKDIVKANSVNEYRSYYKKYSREIRKHCISVLFVPTSVKHRALACVMFVSPKIASKIWIHTVDRKIKNGH